MAQITVAIAGACRDARLTWNAALQPLMQLGACRHGTAFETGSGTAVYSIIVFGDPGDQWTAQVTDGTTTFNHAGHMSPSGFDSTGDTPFPVS